jgi:tRNA/tmRNA/rRNA uracil-C5-methylase (TrmA/RlmC/RlmD family)
VKTTYSEILGPALFPIPQRPLREGECQTAGKKICRLCFAGTITYENEQRKKNEVVQTFWESFETGRPIAPVVFSPSGRQYRTVSKRKAFLVNEQFYLGLIGIDTDTARGFPMSTRECMIEPAEHSAVYNLIETFLRKEEYAQLASEFNYVIVKGAEKEFTVILNMNHFSSGNRQEVNRLSKQLTKKIASVKSVFVFLDEQRSKYYLAGKPKKEGGENKRPLQKLFGADKVFHKVGNKKFLYSPLSFSQTNHSILPAFISTAGKLLDLNKEDLLVDLYCGYGLFSLCLADDVKNVVGIELSKVSISDAIDNASRNKVSNSRFTAADIAEESLLRLFPKTSSPVKVLLDPPRSGTAPGVIEYIAAKQPASVVHIFCNAEIMQDELHRWHKNGYAVDQAVPFDMFPGTNEIEIMVSLKKS